MTGFGSRSLPNFDCFDNIADVKVYFIAICGTGMSALAGLFKERGHSVAGSDIAAYPPVGDLLKSLKIPVCLSYDVEDLKRFAPDYVVIGNFVRRDNPQAQYVMETGIRYGSFPSTLEDFFLKETQNFVVVGTHGKTTTTSCLSFLLSEAGRKPSFLIGGVPVNFGLSFHVGEGKDFVIEGDEYDTAFFDKESKFLHYRPKYGIFNAMEFDHADIFPSNEAMEAMFRKFVHLIPADGKLFYCRDWERVHELIQEEKKSGHFKGATESYGFSDQSDFVISEFKDSANGLSFKFLGKEFSNSMNGKFNAHNFAGALLAAKAAGVDLSVLQKSLPAFLGVKRRQEVVGKVGEHLVIDDFAHHPTAVERVLEGIRAKYPNHKICTFFEPRSNTSRRNILQKEFESAFLGSDLTLIAELFKKEAILEKDRLDLNSIAEKHRAKGVKIEVGLDIPQMVSHATDLARRFPTVMLVLSNGSFEGLHQKLISALKLL